MELNRKLGPRSHESGPHPFVRSPSGNTEHGWQRFRVPLVTLPRLGPCFAALGNYMEGSMISSVKCSVDHGTMLAVERYSIDLLYDILSDDLKEKCRPSLYD